MLASIGSLVTYARGPSLRMICDAQSHVFLYFDASRLCMRVLTTSSGVLPNTLAAPAMRPHKPVMSNGTGALCALLVYFLRAGENELQIRRARAYLPVLILQRFHDEEAYGLIRALLEHRGCETLVRPTDACSNERERERENRT